MFQAELSKRILKWPRYFLNTALITALDDCTSKVLEKKLGFLWQMMEKEDHGLSMLARESLCDDTFSRCLVDLEETMMIT